MKNILSITVILFVIPLIFSCEKLGIMPKEKEVKPTVDFTFSENQDGVVSFSSATTGKIDSYFWTFGTQHSSNEANPKYELYTKNGTYNVQLLVKGLGGDAIVSKGVQIKNIKGRLVFWISHQSFSIDVSVSNQRVYFSFAK
jgi:PKD repeat protein